VCYIVGCAHGIGSYAVHFVPAASPGFRLLSVAMAENETGRCPVAQYICNHNLARTAVAKMLRRQGYIPVIQCAAVIIVCGPHSGERAAIMDTLPRNLRNTPHGGVR
jgi:hypothetical protein